MKRTTPTALGEVNYETVECASCEQEVLKDEARDFIVGEVLESHDWGTLGKVEFGLNRSNYETGYLCPYCQHEDGLLGVKLGPRHVINLSNPIMVAFTGFMLAMLIAMTVAVIF